MSNQDQHQYEVQVHNRVTRFLRSRRELASNWEEILNRISLSPKRGGKISHLKGKFFCNYRWRQGTYRFIYQVKDEENLVHVYQAGTRGSVYGS